MTQRPLVEQAIQLLEAISDPRVPRDVATRATARLSPRKEDYPRLFKGTIGDQVRIRYAVLWGTQPVVLRRPEEPSCLAVYSARAKELSAGAQGFAPEYQICAAWLEPDPLWIAWRFHDDSGRRSTPIFDALVWTGVRWVLLPRPTLVMRDGTKAKMALENWA
jgi:hypothetical protein